MTEAVDQIWRQFESLLEEAVMRHHCAGVEMLLEFEQEGILSNIPRYKPRNFIPLMLAIDQAIERKNVSIVHIFRKHKYSLPEPHASNCQCSNCTEDKLGRTKCRLMKLKVFANPVWISVVSEDPFLSLFKLARWNKYFGQENASFHQQYNVIQRTATKLSSDLLDEVRSEEEGSTLMRHKAVCRHHHNSCQDLSFIVLAIEYDQKEVVAHPVVQHFLHGAVFDDVPGWSTGSIGYKIFLVTILALAYPITSALNIFCPSSRCATSLGNIAMKPFVKFVNGAASFITFLLLLAVMSAHEQVSGIRGGKWPPHGIEIIVFVWLIGFCFGECTQVYKNGVRKYFTSGWNWVDVGMDSLMLLSFIAWLILTLDEKHRGSKAYIITLHVADGAFTVAIILSFFRIIYLCQITSYLGLLQLCFSQMILVIFQFTFICIIVLLAFTVGMVFLFHASDQGKLYIATNASKYSNHSDIYTVLVENFNGFWSTLFTMIYVSLSMQGTETLRQFEDGSLIHLWSSLLFICYYGITMIVVLNMLIAMMNNSYQRIADNLTMEHLYSQTKLWLEYVGDEQTRPVPLNLVPPLRKVVSWVRKCDGTSREMTGKLKEDEEIKYKNVCEKLMERYMRRVYGFYANDDMDEGDSKRRRNDPFIRRIEVHFQMWHGIITNGLQETTFYGPRSYACLDEEKPDRYRRHSAWITA